MSFEKKSLLEKRRLTLEELEKYYMELRKYNFENNVPLKNIEARKKIHMILYRLIQLERILSKEELHVINDKSIKTDNSIVYACTHIGGNDIQRTFEAIKNHAYLFLGDPKELYRDITGKILFLNGDISFETWNKEDRKIAYHRAIELLNKGGNLLIYPEGAWNVSENEPVMGLYKGAVKMAAETKSDIIPVALEQYDNKFFVNIGENMPFHSLKSNDLDVRNIELRDNLATLKWEIWETQGINKRDIVALEKDTFQQSIVDKCEYSFTLQDVFDTMYHDPNKVSADEVFKVLKKVR